MRFTKTLSALGAIGVAGTLAFAATPATAATSSVQADARLTGQFQTATAAGYTNRTNWVPSGAGVNTGTGGEWTFPATGTSGPIYSVTADKCLTMPVGAGAGTPMKLDTCDGGENQGFTIGSNGSITISAGGNTGKGITDYGSIGAGPLVASIVSAGYDVLWLDILTPVAAVAPLTGDVVSVDAGTREAVVGGTGEPGARIEVQGPTGTQTTTVKADGTWTVTVPGLADGDNDLAITQTAGTDVQTKTVTATILPSPIVDPAIAGGAGIAAIAALGTMVMIRRRATA